MVIEATCQVQERQPSTCPRLVFRQVKFVKALVLPDSATPIELFTELRPAVVSNMSDSKIEWQFRISSCVGEQCTLHASESVAVDGNSNLLQRGIVCEEERMEAQAPHVWFQRFIAVGLILGSPFQRLESVYCDRQKCLAEARTKLTMFHGEEATQSGDFQYSIHPVILDAMLQTTFIASVRGNVKNMSCRIPMAIDEMITGDSSSMKAASACSISAKCHNTSFGAYRKDAELCDSNEAVLVHMKGIKVSPYYGAGAMKRLTRGRPCSVQIGSRTCHALLRRRLPNQLNQYIELFKSDKPHLSDHFDIHPVQVAACVDLVTHKRPRSRILLLGLIDEGLERLCLRLLTSCLPFKFFELLHSATVDKEGRITSAEIRTDESDSILAVPMAESVPVDFHDFDVIVVQEVC